ncbi:hypothetical protein ACF3M1_07470 [Luteimonas sp. WGS1318]|uniref:hypothetical protein n=1 Tax=Luteimonas sp. WGS1318 TaxID=3366815 RepID=UPI00372CEA47
MNRRLQTPIFACAASTATLVVGLLVAWPAFPAEEAAGAGANATAAAGETRTPAKATVDGATTTPPTRSRSKRARSAIAMPYFSFARGTGGRS